MSGEGKREGGDVQRREKLAGCRGQTPLLDEVAGDKVSSPYELRLEVEGHTLNLLQQLLGKHHMSNNQIGSW